MSIPVPQHMLDAALIGNERLRDALHQISLASQNSMSSKEECGRIARTALKEPVACHKRWNDECACVRNAILCDGVEPEPRCGCHKCNEGVTINGIPFASTRMILCPTCGNKRCPHASDHRLACTYSNEPGQAGSVYPALAEPEPEPVAMSANGLSTLAHLWAQQCYLKGLGKPCDIDIAREAFEQELKAYTASLKEAK